jgi:hypothetical protein
VAVVVRKALGKRASVLAAARQAYQQALAARRAATTHARQIGRAATTGRGARALALARARTAEQARAKAAEQQRALDPASAQRWEKLAQLAAARDAASGSSDEFGDGTGGDGTGGDGTGGDTGTGSGETTGDAAASKASLATELVEQPTVDTVAAARARRFANLAAWAAERDAQLNSVSDGAALDVAREGGPKSGPMMWLTGFAASGLAAAAGLALHAGLRARRTPYLDSEVLTVLAT